jgi:hypothetical protein
MEPAPILVAGSVLDLLRKIEKGRPERFSGAEEKLFALNKELIRILDNKVKKSQSSFVPLSPQEVKMLEGVTESLKQVRAESSRISNIAEAIKSLETIVKGQETLQQVTPLIQALGEPTFILFPQIIQNMLARMELVYYPPLSQNQERSTSKEDEKEKRVEQNKEKDSRGKPKQQRKKVHFSLPLPNMGNVDVEFSHTLTEMLLTINCQSTELSEFVEQRIEQLKNAFYGLGYESVAIKAQHAESVVIRPAWLGAIVDSLPGHPDKP